MPKCIILRGVPCSGKTTFRKSITEYGWHVLSCDDIRIQMYGKNYKFSNDKEQRVWEYFYSSIEEYVLANCNIIIDNTNLKHKYIRAITELLPNNYEVEIKTFHVSLWKAHLRNIIRRIKTGKWIPWKVMKTMHNNYKKIKA